MGRNVNNLRYADDTTLMAESREDKEPLDESEREEWKGWLKTQHSKDKVHGIQSHLTWQIDGEAMETVKEFISLGSKITAGGDCSHEIKTLAPWKESYDQLRLYIKKQRHYFPNKVPSIESHGFSSSHVWMWKLDRKESWALKNWCF